MRVLLFILFFSLGSLVYAQEKITGKVTGTGGRPLAGASIIVQGRATGVTSGTDGDFILEANVGEVLVFSYMGYRSRFIKIDPASAILNILLVENITQLDQVVLTGYSTQKVKEITGSVVVVKPKDLTAIPAGTTEQMLQGRAAGLTVITSGEPGAAANIRIRGIGNFGDVRPLYMIDGIPGDINSINPDDIESLQVLKDASAYSIYGVRGANGVIIVTTRKGKSGRTRVSYEMFVGWQQPLKGLDILSPQEWADLTWKAYRNSGQLVNGNPNHPLYGNGVDAVLPDYLFAGPHQDTLFEGSPYVDPSLYNLNPDNGDIYQIVRFNKKGTDWFHEVYKPAFSQNHTATVSGGNDNSKFLVSMGYLDQQGTMVNTFLKRFTTRINSDFNVEKKFHFGENLQLSYTDNKRPEKFLPGIITSNYNDANSAIFTAPYQPVYDINGGWNPQSNRPSNGPDDNVAARRSLAKDNTSRQWLMLGNVYASMDFLKNFNARTSFGGSLTNYFNAQFTPSSYDNVTTQNKYSEASGFISSYTWTNTLQYQQIIKQHSVKVMAGTEFINSENRENGGTVFDLQFTDPDYWSLSNGDPYTKTNYTNASVSALSSLIGRVDYGYKDRYYFTGTIRKDGASYFGPENRYGWFPSAGLAWRLTEENFLQKVKWINELKIRGSWGKTGFYGNTDPSNQYTLYGGNIWDAYYDINGNSSGAITSGFRTLRLGNVKTGWQEDIVTNVGVDAIFWKGKLSVSVDGYIKKTEGLLFPLQLPALLGDALPPNVNVGSIENRGIDVTIGSRGSFSSDLRWDMLLTFTHYNNKITKLTDIPYFDDFDSKIRNEVGYPIGSFFGYKVIGLFRDDGDVSKSPKQLDAAPGRFKYADTNGRDASGKLTGKPDGTIDDADRIHLASPHPDFTIGFNIGINFKNIDFSTFFYGSFGNTVANDVRASMEVAPYNLGVANKTALYNSWSPDQLNAIAPIPEVTYNFSNAGGPWNSYALESGSYLRNKSVMLGYTLSAKQLSYLKLDRLRVYVQVVNLFTITNYSGLDPELYKSPISPASNFATNSVFGIDFGNYPNNQRQFLIGINIGL